MNFARVVAVLEENGFSLARHGKGSHRVYRGVVEGQVRLVVVAAHKPSEDVKAGTLASIIRTSGLAKHLFR